MATISASPPAGEPADVRSEGVAERSGVRTGDAARRRAVVKRRAAAKRRAVTQRRRARAAPQRRRAAAAPKARRGRRVSGLTPTYRRMRAYWHAPAPRAAVVRFKKAERPPLELRRTGDGPTVQLTPLRRDGGFDHAALREAAEVLAWPNDADGIHIEPRLLDLVYQACRRFGAPYVHVISGYRNTRASSRHAQGRAMDVVLPGVPDRQLARHFSEQGFVGVGIYPTSGFVHVDVRHRSYFWMDRSGPGQPQRGRQILAERVLEVDRRARRRGVKAVMGEGEEVVRVEVDEEEMLGGE